MAVDSTVDMKARKFVGDELDKVEGEEEERQRPSLKERARKVHCSLRRKSYFQRSERYV